MLIYGSVEHSPTEVPHERVPRDACVWENRRRLDRGHEKLMNSEVKSLYGLVSFESSFRVSYGFDSKTVGKELRRVRLENLVSTAFDLTTSKIPAYKMSYFQMILKVLHQIST